MTATSASPGPVRHREERRDGGNHRECGSPATNARQEVNLIFSDLSIQERAELANLIITKLAAEHGRGTTLSHLLTISQVEVCFLSGAECTASELQRATGIPSSTISNILKKFVGTGYLVQQPDSDDERRRIIGFGPLAYGL